MMVGDAMAGVWLEVFRLLLWSLIYHSEEQRNLSRGYGLLA